MKVATVGTGNMGTGLGRQVSEAGHEVISAREIRSGRARRPRRSARPVTARTPRRAQAEAFLLAVNWWDLEGVLPQLGDVAGKILIDCPNPYTDNTYSIPADLSGRAGAEVIQERLPGARVVKSWNHVYAQIVNSSPDFGGRAASVLLASDDAQAKEAVARLARDAGYDPWDAGALWSAFIVEKVAAVMITIAYVVGTRTDQALKLVSR